MCIKLFTFHGITALMPLFPAVGQLYRPVSVNSSYTSPDSNVGRSYEHLRVVRVSSLAASFSQSARLTSSEAQTFLSSASVELTSILVPL